MSRPGKRRRWPPVPEHRGRRRGAAGSGEAAGTRPAPAGGPEAEVGTRFSAFPAAAGRSPPYPLQASPVLTGLRPLRAGSGPGPVAAAGGAAGARHGRAPGWGVQHPRSSPLHPGAGRVNASVQGVGSFHWGGGWREGGSFTPFLPGSLAEPCSWKLPPVSPLGWFVWSLQSCRVLLYWTEICRRPSYNITAGRREGGGGRGEKYSR